MIGYVLKKAPLKERLVANDDTPDGYRRLAVIAMIGWIPMNGIAGWWEFTEVERESLRRLSRELTQADLATSAWISCGRRTGRWWRSS